MTLLASGCDFHKTPASRLWVVDSVDFKGDEEPWVEPSGN
jgi:hypothetical protein